MTHQQADPIQILILEDSDDDKELIQLELQKEGLHSVLTRVESEQEFRRALQVKEWDLVLSDYSLPAFDGLSALNILKEMELDTPFILISGKIGEGIAVQAMKSGASDYILKENLNRLVPAIKRELKEAAIRQEHRHNLEERKLLIKVLESSRNEIYIFEIDTLRFLYANEAALNNLGYTEEELSKFTAAEINPNIADDEYKAVIGSLEETGKLNEIFVTEHLRKDGSHYPIEVQFTLIKHNGTEHAAMIGIDVTNQTRDKNIIRQQKKLAKELEQQSEYKSTFLANMSHELRTPLNTMILLSDLIRKNREENLTEEQIHKLEIIKNSGDHLLELINQVLDLSKVEAGQMQFELSSISLSNILNPLKEAFQSISEEKGLVFGVQTINPETLPEKLFTDPLRLRQTLKNLLSNSFKFTKSGSITLSVSAPDDSHVLFKVKDTGIGIPAEKQKVIFQSFQQADGSTSRNYGGTGLGLSIAREFTESLGGTISVKSRKGEGAEFSVLLPVDSTPYIDSAQTQSATERQVQQEISHSNVGEINPGTLVGQLENVNTNTPYRTIVLYSSDPEVNRTLNQAAISADCRILAAQTLQEFKNILCTIPCTKCIIDYEAGEFSGWTVLKKLSGLTLPTALLVSRETESMHPGLQQEVDIFLKPLSVETAKETLTPGKLRDTENSRGSVLLVDDSEIHSEVMVEFLADSLQSCDVAYTAKKALEKAAKRHYDVIVLDLTLPDQSGHEVLATLKRDPQYHSPHVIIYSGRHLDNEEERNLSENADGIITKNIGSIKKLKQLIESLLTSCSPQKIGAELSNTEDYSGLRSAHVLVTDDDFNSYLSLASHFEDLGITVSYAENGQKAVEWLENHPGKADAVMLDMMMPVMDGYEALNQIRNELRFTDLPVFALTAKAMKGDRELCLKSGATDYISKPINMEQILQVLQTWIN